MTGNDLSEFRFLEVRQFIEVNQASTIFWSSNCQGDGRQIFGSHNPNGVDIPSYNGGIVNRFFFKLRRSRKKLHWKTMDYYSLLIKL